MNKDIATYFKNLHLPDPQSHKGQNGKLLIIGGSGLFHAASKWSLDVASHFVDMVFYSSVPENNELIQQAKANFWNGIVIRRQDIESYIDEADCVLIGPGMERQELQSSQQPQLNPPTDHEWDHNTQVVINYLLEKYVTKKWVIDAGALQMVDPSLLNSNCIITPHQLELKNLVGNPNLVTDLKSVESLPKQLGGATILVKGVVDIVAGQERALEIAGGNPGMTKGGTGDVLAGLVAALYCTNDAMTAAVVGSYVNKKAGEILHEEFGPFFNASELVQAVPKTLWSMVQESA
jgi:hydroxyethylthiazole kinase-like uncharacterized protein yjeF